MKVLPIFIFGGSQTIGWMKAGFDVDKVLEMTDDMIENNSYHFSKNYTNIEIVPPSIWNNKSYLESLTGYDVFCGNPPCSGLSQINRNAKADSHTNDHIYDFINIVMTVKPKIFFFENAPTLVKLGLPILKTIQNIVKDDYKMTVITDLAGNHSVPMERRRTLTIGWRKDIFPRIPKIDSNTQPKMTLGEALKGLTDKTPNMELDKGIYEWDKNLFQYYYLAPNYHQTIGKTLIRQDIFDKVKDTFSESQLKYYTRLKEKYEKQNGGIWDKSAIRLSNDEWAPSMTSLSKFIHPTENRDFYVREYARLMGYPDDFIFYQNECKCPAVQCLAQGVPVNFIKYIADEIKLCLENDRGLYDCDLVYINQASGKQKIIEFTADQFQHSLQIDKNDVQLYHEVGLW